MITTKKLYSALQTSVCALTCTSCSVCWCSSSKIGKVCSAVQCSRIRWITLQPYGWVESTNTLKIGLQTEVKPTEAHIYCDITVFKLELNIPTTIKKSFACQDQNSVSSKSQERRKSRFLCVKDSRNHVTKNSSVHYNVSSLHRCLEVRPLVKCCSTFKLSFLLNFQILRLWHL